MRSPPQWTKREYWVEKAEELLYCINILGAFFSVLAGLQNSGARVTELTLSQWGTALLGGALSAMGLLVALVYVLGTFEDSTKLKTAFNVNLAVGVLLLAYGFGAVAAYNLSLSRSESYNQATVNGIWSWGHVAQEFYGHMSAYKDVPLGDALTSFRERMTAQPQSTQ